MKKAVGGKTRVDLAVDQIIQVILDRDMKAGDKPPTQSSTGILPNAAETMCCPISSRSSPRRSAL